MKERNTPEEIAAKYGITPSLVTAWKEALLVGDLFGELTRLKEELTERKRKDKEAKKQLEESNRELEILRKKTKR